ncbi:MAG: TonB family protein [Desulfuromonadales bacterium]|nr:TonB family protein [Desulfuromonadales bacterium]
MSDRYVEKSFLYLLLFSLLFHVGVFVLLLYLPPKQTPPPKEPVFVDLQQMPDAKLPRQPTQQEVRRQSDRRRRVERETAPRGFDNSDAGVRPPREAVRPLQRQAVTPGQSSQPGPPLHRETQVPEGSSTASLLKPRSPSGRPQGQPKLFPGAGGMARLEENYRRKFEKDIAEGDTKFLNTEDIQFGSFLRRFENSVYGVWRYPQEAARNGVEGITPVKITFNRKGEVVNVELLESSGAKILDEEVLRTLKLIGPVGNFPRGYDKDEFHLIAFFQYGLTRRSVR